MSSLSKVILVTGASSGIGEATARVLAAAGHKLILGARREDRINAIAGEIRASGGDATALPLDVTDRVQFQAFADRAKELHGRIDVLVNNAGVMPLSRLDEMKVEEWDQMVDVNIKGVLYGIAAVLPGMTARKSGHIINVASVSAYSTGPTVAVYSATKYAVRALTEGLRSETKELRVTLVSPGITTSELFHTITSDAPKQLLDSLAEIAMPASTIADAIAYAISQPANIDVNEIVVRPTALW